MPCSIARSVIITARRCVENEPVRKNPDTEQPAFGRNAGVQAAVSPYGRAKITKGYNLPAKFVLHTVGPAVSGDVTQEDEIFPTDWRGFLSGGSFSSWQSLQ